MIYAMHIRPARAPDGSDDPDRRLHQQLFVLADDARHRAVPLWLRIHKGLRGRVARVARVDRLDRPAGDAGVAGGLLETAVRLLRTAGTEVSAVDIEPASDDVPELRWDTVTARVGLATARGTRPVTVSAEYGLALAAVAVDIPIRRYGRLFREDSGRAAVTVRRLFVRPAGKPGAGRLLLLDGCAGAAQVLAEGEGRVGGALGQVVVEGGLLAQRLAFPHPAGPVPLDLADLARGGQHRAGLPGRHEHDAVVIGEAPFDLPVWLTASYRD
jgi:hypothetical protein